MYKLTFPLTTGVLKFLQALDIPSILFENCHIISLFSGFPKFKQFVIAKGFPPDAIIFLVDSATAILAPTDGFNKQYPELQFVVRQRAFLLFFILTTAESDPGLTMVSVPTI